MNGTMRGRLVVRNGCHQPRKGTTAAGAVEVRAPRVNDKRTDPQPGERKRFSSAILPLWARKSPKISEVLPLLYLHGLSSGDFVPALEQFLGSSAGLSLATVTRLTAVACALISAAAAQRSIASAWRSTGTIRPVGVWVARPRWTGAKRRTIPASSS